MNGLRSSSRGSGGDRLEHTPDGLKIGKISLLGASGDLVELPSDVRLQARFARIIVRIDDLHLHLDRESSPLHPPFPGLASLTHGRSAPIVNGDQFRPTTLRHPSPDRLDLRAINQELRHHHRRVWLAGGSLSHQLRVLKVGDELPSGYASLLATLFGMQGDQELSTQD
jgi:hypothetical protein